MVSIREDKKSNTTPTPEKSEKIVIIREDQKKQNEKPNTPSPFPTTELLPTPTTKECKKEVGPIKITSPSEEEVMQDDLICVKIDYTVAEYCSVAWSYKLDANKWSDYTSSPFCFSKLDPGKHELDLRVQSTASNDETTLERTFYYKTKEISAISTPTITP